MRIVFDSSTLILLAKANLLYEVAAAAIDIIISEEVKRECLVKKTTDSELISLLIQKGGISVEKEVDVKSIKKLQIDFRIARGEAETIWLSKKRLYPIAIDDGPGIKACKVLGLQFVTAVHFLLHLASRSKLSSELAKEKLTKLGQYGRYNQRIIEDAVKRLEKVRK